MTWIAIGVAGVTTAAGAIQSNNTRQREKGILGKAYTLGVARQNLRQQDTRQSVAESSVARGLSQGGNVRVGGPASASLTTSVSGAHDLGGQQTADLAREQNLEAESLKESRDTSLSEINAAADQGYINSAVAGINAGVNVASAIRTPVVPGLPSSPSSTGVQAGPMVDTPPPASAYPGSWNGVDPVDPLNRGKWSTANFNVYSDV